MSEENRPVDLPATPIMDAIAEFAENLIRDVGQEQRASFALGTEPEPVKTLLACLPNRLLLLGIAATNNLDEYKDFFGTLYAVSENAKSLPNLPGYQISKYCESGSDPDSTPA